MISDSARNWIAVDAVQQSVLNKKQNMTTLHLKKSMDPSRSRLALLLIPLVFACFVLSPTAQAVVPAPDGCYSNFTTAEGCNALGSLTTGAGNTGVGWYSLFSNATGSFNTGVGVVALALNNADNNTAVGAGALFLNTTGEQNAAVGANALVHNDSGSDNNAFGTNALFDNVDGFFNNAHGRNALAANTIGNNNTAVGDLALRNSTGDYNTALGANAGTDPEIVSNNIYIGDTGFAGDNNTIAIGGIAASGTDYKACFIGGIYGASVNMGTAAAVYVDTDGRLGTVLAAAKGKPSAVPLRRGHGAEHQVMLNRKVEKLQATTAHQQKQIARQQKQISQQQRQIEILTDQLKAQTAQIQKVTAQLEASKPAPQVVNNH